MGGMEEFGAKGVLIRGVFSIAHIRHSRGVSRGGTTPPPHSDPLLASLPERAGIIRCTRPGHGMLAPRRHVARAGVRSDAFCGVIPAARQHANGLVCAGERLTTVSRHCLNRTAATVLL